MSPTCMSHSSAQLAPVWSSRRVRQPRPGVWATGFHFVPPVSPEELTGFIGEADFSLILYSGQRFRNLTLAMPNKLFDSLAAGVPVVAAQDPWPAISCSGKDWGASSIPMCQWSWRRRCGAVSGDPRLADRVRSVRSQFTWDRVEPALLALVDELSATRHRPDERARRYPPMTTRWPIFHCAGSVTRRPSTSTFTPGRHRRRDFGTPRGQPG